MIDPTSRARVRAAQRSEPSAAPGRTGDVPAQRERLAWLALAAVPGLGRRSAWRLVERLGGANRALHLPIAQLRSQCGAEVAEAIASARDLATVAARVDADAARRIAWLTGSSAELPERLRAIPDPPWVLTARGPLDDAPTLAIVGARKATERGRGVARSLARAAARAGIRIVSGLAYGIDAAAHQGALDAGSASWVVLASGVDRPSPRGNVALAVRVLEAGGAWISEYPPDAGARAHQFPERNRLISGLAHAVLVVEAQERSGSLWTVRHALDQGRDVLVVPGPVDSDLCRGSNALLRDGAAPVLGSDDVLGWFGIAPRAERAPGPPAAERRAEEGARRDLPAAAASGVAPPASRTVDPLAESIVRALGDGPTDLDSLARAVGAPMARLSAALTDLELERRVVRVGSRVARA